jgi:general stress protein 26
MKKTKPAIGEAESLQAQESAAAGVQQEALKLVQKSKICMLGTMGESGLISIRAMLNLKNRGLKQIWFSTNTASKKVSQIATDKRASVYYVDAENFQGLLLQGTIQILQDLKSKKMMWMEGAEAYYPLGVNDPDYTVLKFTAQRADYYNNLINTTFDVK